MLILTRRNNEEVVIGSGENAIRVKIVSISGNRVQIAIDAPKEIPVKRKELDD